MFDIPVTVESGKQSYTIRDRGDFRMVLDCFVALNAVEISKEERIFAALEIFYEDFNSLSDIYVVEEKELDYLIKKMFWFFNCGSEDSGSAAKHQLIDWEKDEQLISSAINKVAGREIRFEPYIHWWIFMGYYLAIGESPLATIVSIRNKIVEGTKLEKYEQKFRKENPQYFNWNYKTLEELEAENYILSIWNSGG